MSQSAYVLFNLNKMNSPANEDHGSSSYFLYYHDLFVLSSWPYLSTRTCYLYLFLSLSIYILKEIERIYNFALILLA